MGIGDWGWGLGIGPIPNPQSPFTIYDKIDNLCLFII